MIQYKKNIRKNISIAIVFALIASVVSSIQILGLSRDYSDYEKFFDAILEYGCSVKTDFRFEEGYNGLTCLLSQFIYSSNLIYAAQVFISIFTKILVLITISRGNIGGFYSATILYTCKFFPIHELTQLRASLSISITYLSILLIDIIRDKKYNKPEDTKTLRKLFFGLIVCFLLAVFVHVSSLLVIPFILASIKANNRRKSMYLIAVTLVFCIVLGDILTNLALNYIPSTITYVNSKEGFGGGSVSFTFSKFIDLSLIIFVLSGWPKINFDHLLTRVSFNVFACSLAIFLGFLQYPVVALRFYDFMQTFLVIFICSLENKNKIFLFLPWIIFYSINSILFFLNNDYFFPIRN